MTLKTEIMSGLKWTAGAKLAGQVFTWGITLYVMRLLEPTDYGLLAISSVCIAFLFLTAEIGLGPALVQKSEVSEETLQQAFGVIIIVNLTLMILLNLTANTIASYFDEPRLALVLRVLSLQFLFTAFTVIPQVQLQRKLEFKHRSLIDLSSAVVNSVTTLVLALAHVGVWSVVFGGLAASIFNVIAVNYVSSFKKQPRFSLSGMRKLFSFAGNVTASRLMWFFYTQVDTLIVGKMLGKEVLGLYSVAMHLASLPVQRVSGILNQVAFPAFARFQEDRSEVTSQLLKALRLISFFSFPILWGISCNADGIVRVFLGEKWLGAIIPFQILALIMPLRMLANFLPSISDALGHPEIGLQNVIVSCIVMPIAFFIAARWGIIGIAMAWATAYPAVLAINTDRTLAIVGLRYGTVWRAIGPSIMCALAMYVAVESAGFLLHSHISEPILLISKISIGIIAYVALTLIFNRSTFDLALRVVKPSYAR